VQDTAKPRRNLRVMLATDAASYVKGYDGQPWHSVALPLQVADY